MRPSTGDAFRAAAKKTLRTTRRTLSDTTGVRVLSQAPPLSHSVTYAAVRERSDHLVEFGLVVESFCHGRSCVLSQNKMPCRRMGQEAFRNALSTLVRRHCTRMRSCERATPPVVVIRIELSWSPPCLACACWPMTSVLKGVFRDLRTGDEYSVALTTVERGRGARSQAMNSRFACGRTSAAYWTDEPLVRALGRTSLIGVLYVCTLLDGPLLFLLGHRDHPPTWFSLPRFWMVP
jgi:hypothetical protein